MKRFLAFISLLLIFPMCVSAQEYKIEDMTLKMDDSIWYIFTRDNIKNNKELEELGVSYDYMAEVFNNNYIYVDAVLYYEDSEEFIELFVRRKENNSIQNLSSFDKTELKEFIEEMGKKQNTDNCELYTNDYKYSHCNYLDSKLGFYVDEYYTIVNGYGYTITVQKTTEFDKDEVSYIRNIVDAITFNIDTSLKENESTDSILLIIIICSVVGGLSAGVSAIAKLKRKMSN